MVKPILKKRSTSDKNSLDLDRPWEEQHVPGLAGLTSGYDLAGPTRSARDVSFSFTDTALPSVPRFHHGRSHSGASHVSVATTASGGGTRPSPFVHPFQQTPRTHTPPLTYANSIASLDGSAAFHNTASSSIRDSSPTITENDDDDYPVGSLPTHRYHHSHTTSLSQSSLRHHSLSSQRAASFSDINAAPPLRLNTARSLPGGRRGHGSSGLSSSLSHSDLNLNASGGSAVFDSPLSLTSGPNTMSPFAPNGAGAVPSSSNTASPLRTSLEGIGLPRLRSRSEVDAGARADQIREARRKFEERERAKEEKHDREMLRKRERRDHRDAKVMERQAAAQLRKNSGTGSDVIRPSFSQDPTPTFGSSASARASGDAYSGRDSGRFVRQPNEITEKELPFKSSNYSTMAGGTTPSFGPNVESVAFKNARRNNTTKRKTQGYWNGFVLWLRTRIFRIGRT